VWPLVLGVVAFAQSGWTLVCQTGANAVAYRTAWEWSNPACPPEQWWRKAKACPNGIRRVDTSEDGGRERWCEVAGLGRHGPSIRWDAEGNRVEDGMWVDGKRAGLWFEWDVEGRISSIGAYNAGHRWGGWVHCDDGRLSRREGWLWDALLYTKDWPGDDSVRVTTWRGGAIESEVRSPGDSESESSGVAACSLRQPNRAHDQ